MDEILVDNIYYSPYFILDVTPEDNIEFITKAFKKKAKTWHPDKLSLIDKKDDEKVNKQYHRFKILVESYEYIINKKKTYNNSHIDIKNNFINNNNFLKADVSKNNFTNETIDKFNIDFEKSKVEVPNDYGYKTQRITNLQEYENNDFKPTRLFNSFNSDDFNKAFEYSQNESLQSSDAIGLYHTTTDGFNAYNSGDLNGASCVSSYNGLMIVGDDFGKSGKGYYDTNYSDYKISFNTAKNPDIINIPNDFIPTNKNTMPLTKEESIKQLELQKNYRNIDFKQNSSKYDFNLQQDLFLKKQESNLLDKIEHDKEFISQYKDIYDKDTIESAFNKSLITNDDYCDHTNIDKIFYKVNLS